MRRPSLIIGACAGAIVLLGSARAHPGTAANLDRPQWKQQDIGPVTVKGDGRQENGAFVVTGSGAPSGVEALHYMFVPVPDDGELTARVESTISLDPSVRVGLMIRSAAAPGAAEMSLMVGKKGTLTVRYRAAAASREVAAPPTVQLLQVPPADSHPRLRLAREGRRVSALYSRDGKTWESLFVGDIDAPKGLLFGFAATTDGSPVSAGAFSGPFLATASFREVGLRAPFRGHPIPIPGTIEAEDFDSGGEGVSYSDSDKVNHGSDHWPHDQTREEPPYRDTEVDVAPTLAGDAFYLGWTKPGEWTEYSVTVAADGMYRFEVRVAFVSCGGTFHVEVDGTDKTGPLHVPNTHNWDTDWELVTKKDVSLSAGPHRVRLVMDSMERARGVGNFDSIRIAPMSSPEPSRAKAAVPSWGPARVTGHPRLLVSPSRLDVIRKSIHAPGSLPQQAFDSMKRRVDKGDWRAYLRASQDQDNYWNLARATLAKEAAFLYLLTDDAQYATIAYRTLDEIYTESDPEKVTLEYDMHELGVLTRSLIADSFALSYDWCFKAWSPAQQETMRKRIESALDTWPCVGAQHLQAPYQRPDVAMARTAELLLILATDNEAARAERYGWLQDMLRQHISSAYGPSGFSPDGLASTEEGGIHLAAAVNATHGIGDDRLTPDFGQHSWWRFLMYAHALGTDVGFVQNEDDRPGPLPQRGWASLLLSSVPEGQLPYYLWFYNRLIGSSSSKARAGEDLWMLLYYPESTSERAPDDSFPPALEDDKHGAFYFRNRWHGEDDILISALADAWSTPRQSYNVAETFDLNVIAYGRRFAASHGAEKTEPYLFSTLVVDGQAYKHGVDTGGVDAFEPNASGGYVVLDGGTKYQHLGLAKAKRHVLVAFEPNGGGALLSTVDRLEALTSHIYTWQLHLGQGIRATNAVEDGVPTFLLSADNGAFVKGWVMTPGAIVVPDDPLQVSVKGQKTDLWIVMFIGKGEPPRAHVTGAGLTATLEIGKRTVRFEAKSNRAVSSVAN
jgi:Carbohydrate binding module (family 6)